MTQEGQEPPEERRQKGEVGGGRGEREREGRRDTGQRDEDRKSRSRAWATQQGRLRHLSRQVGDTAPSPLTASNSLSGGQVGSDGHACVRHTPPAPSAGPSASKPPLTPRKHCPCPKPHVKRSMRIIRSNPHSHLTPLSVSVPDGERFT